jgi:hypothetical protein
MLSRVNKSLLLSVIMLNAIMLSVVKLSVVAPLLWKSFCAKSNISK